MKTKWHKAKTCKWRPDWKLTKDGRLMGDVIGQCKWTLRLAYDIHAAPPGVLEPWRIDYAANTYPMRCERCEAYEPEGGGSNP